MNDNNLMFSFSEIYHFTMCPREWFYEHFENAKNITSNMKYGKLLHKRVDTNKYTSISKNRYTQNSIWLRSDDKHLYGIADAIDFITSEDGIIINRFDKKVIPVVVEYKTGNKQTDAMRLQLLAQVVCANEMFCTNNMFGYIYHFETKEKEKINFTKSDFDKLYKTIEQMISICNHQTIPKQRKKTICNGCSCSEICLPELKKTTVKEYIKEIKNEVNNEETT